MAGSEDKATKASGSARGPADARASTDPKPGDVPSTTPSKDAPKSMLTEGEVVEGRFKLTKLLGAGGQGEVWRAEDLEIEGHVVALKLLFDRARTPDQKEMLLRELRMLASVSHPAVVQFKEHGWLAGRLWFVMPFLAGGSLEEKMPITRPEARRIFETLAGGLSAVHAKGLRHQDIKPSNVFLADVDGLEHPMPMLLDFGVAAKEGETLVAGSPDYFAPELAAGWPVPPQIGPEADVFSLALALRNALEPHTAPTLDVFSQESLDQRGKVPITPPTGRELRFLAPHFARWLSTDPSKRPTAAALAKELAVLTEPEDTRAERRKTIRRLAPWIAVGSVVLAAGGWWGWGQLVEARKAAVAEAAESDAERLAREAAESRAEDLGTRLEGALDDAEASGHRTEEALARLEAAEAEIGRAEGSADALRAARDRLRGALADATAEITTQAAALNETRSTVARMSADLENVRSDLATARSDLAGARSDLAARESELSTARTDRDARTEERDAARARVNELEGRVSALETEASTARANAEASVASAETRAGEAEARVTELEAQVRTLRRELEEARSAGSGSSGGGSSGGSSGGGEGASGGGVVVAPVDPTGGPSLPAP